MPRMTYSPDESWYSLRVLAYTMLLWALLTLIWGFHQHFVPVAFLSVALNLPFVECIIIPAFLEWRFERRLDNALAKAKGPHRPGTICLLSELQPGEFFVHIVEDWPWCDTRLFHSGATIGEQLRDTVFELISADEHRYTVVMLKNGTRSVDSYGKLHPAAPVKSSETHRKVRVVRRPVCS